MPGARFGGPKPDLTGIPTHYAIRGSVNGICGQPRVVKRTQRDDHVSCEGCLRKRLAMHGVLVADRALGRNAATEDERVALLRRALRSSRRLTRWRATSPEAGKRAR